MKYAGPKMIIWDDIIMILLTLVSITLLVLELSANLPAVQVALFDKIDTSIAIIFLIEFVIKFLSSKSKTHFFKTSWWYLLAAIPISTPTTQILRVLRLLRLIRLVRIHRGVHQLNSYAERFIEQTRIIPIIIAWLIVVIFGTLSFFMLEHATNHLVGNLFDSLWWTISTITTVGYGDVYPITTGGRIIGMILMICGIGTTGVLTAFIASFLIKQNMNSCRVF
jgi:voltage-gated potassium channel